MELFKKYSDEVVTLGFNFSSEMETTEVILYTNSSITIYTEEDEDVTDVMLVTDSLAVNDDTILQGTIQGGEVGEFYTIVYFGYISTDKQLVGRATIEIVG